MAISMLNEGINNGENVNLIDGSVWQINTGDMPTLCICYPQQK